MSSPLVKTISKNIRKFRSTSFKELADKAGVPYRTLEKILFLQVKDVQVSTLRKIAKALNVSLDRLVGYKRR